MKQKTTYLMVAALSAILAGCASPGPSYEVPLSVPHGYKVQVKDSAGKPLSGVQISGDFSGLYNPNKQTLTCTTDEAGTCPEFVYQTMRDATSYFPGYQSDAVLVARKDGYFQDASSNSSRYGSKYSSDKPTQDVNFTLYKAVDYLQEGFAKASSDKDLRERMLHAIGPVRSQSFLSDAKLMLNSVGTEEFKGKRYLRVKINSTSVYNTLKMNNYAIGTTLFDGIVRKVVDPLNNAVSSSKSVYGYDVVVVGHSKNFLEKYAIDDDLEYRFLMPESAARRYKNKDISGQELLNSSVVLLNDERIDLKLQ